MTDTIQPVAVVRIERRIDGQVWYRPALFFTPEQLRDEQDRAMRAERIHDERSTRQTAQWRAWHARRTG